MAAGRQARPQARTVERLHSASVPPQSISISLPADAPTKSSSIDSRQQPEERAAAQRSLDFNVFTIQAIRCGRKQLGHASFYGDCAAVLSTRKRCPDTRAVAVSLCCRARQLGAQYMVMRPGARQVARMQQLAAGALACARA